MFCLFQKFFHCLIQEDHLSIALLLQDVDIVLHCILEAEVVTLCSNLFRLKFGDKDPFWKSLQNIEVLVRFNGVGLHLQESSFPNECLSESSQINEDEDYEILGVVKPNVLRLTEVIEDVPRVVCEYGANNEQEAYLRL